jgi:hypothetical protein
MQVFDYCGHSLCDEMKECLRERLGEVDYQLDIRKRVWAEIGRTPPATESMYRI